jgi:cell filamentation protein
VLINKLGIEDAGKLHVAEREITSLRIANAKINVITGNFDSLHLRKIHRYIFGDIYEWAGEIRWVNIAKGNMFCNYEFIEQKRRFALQEPETRGLSERHAQRESAASPFLLSQRDQCSSPVQRRKWQNAKTLYRIFGRERRLQCGFFQVTDKQMTEASATSFLCNYTKMDEIFNVITELTVALKV